MRYELLHPPRDATVAVDTPTTLLQQYGRLTIDWTVHTHEGQRTTRCCVQVPCAVDQAELVSTHLTMMTGQIGWGTPVHTSAFDKPAVNKARGRTVTMLLIPTAHAQVLDGTLLTPMHSAWLTVSYRNRTCIAYLRCTEADRNQLRPEEWGWKVVPNPPRWRIELRRWLPVRCTYTNHVSLLPVDWSATAPDTKTTTATTAITDASDTVCQTLQEVLNV